jgi:ubiquinone biosynthesis accessory factor UbiJ
MVETPDTFSRFVIGALQRAVAGVLALDPAIKAKLVELDGRCVAVQLSKPAIRLLARVHADELRFAHADASDVADLSVSTELGSLLQLGLARLTGAKPSLGIGKIHISGDAELARQLQQITDKFAPDWDAPVIAAFGDVLGFQLAKGARKTMDFAKNTMRSMAEMGSEYLREESRDVISAAELDGFYDDVDELRDRLARAEQRVAALVKLRAK